MYYTVNMKKHTRLFQFVKQEIWKSRGVFHLYGKKVVSGVCVEVCDSHNMFG